MRWLLQLLQWYYRQTPTFAEGQDASEEKTGTPSMPEKYEINVSKNGRHVFATDSHVRNYRDVDIAEIVKLFRTAFPDCKISVKAFDYLRSRDVPKNIQYALEGPLEVSKDKILQKVEKKVDKTVPEATNEWEEPEQAAVV